MERNELCNYPIDTKSNVEEDNFREITTLEEEEDNVENDLNAADTLPHMPTVQVYFYIIIYLIVDLHRFYSRLFTQIRNTINEYQ